jgi:NADH-quinone oxidoreductase subunit L
MFRLVYLTFFGKFRGTHEQEHHLHESPRSMTIPLVILAVGAVVAGWVGIPAGMWELFGASDHNLFHHFLSPVVATVPGEHAAGHAISHGVEIALILASIGVAVAGILLARRFWGGETGVASDEAFARRAPLVHRLLENKYYVDEIYDRFVVVPLGRLARFCWKVIDTVIIDGGLHVVAFLTELAGDLGRFTTTGNVRQYALYFFAGALALFWWMIF